MKLIELILLTTFIYTLGRDYLHASHINIVIRMTITM